MASVVVPNGVDRHLWLGMRAFSELHCDRGCKDEDIVKGLVAAVTEFSPDLVIVGNLHGAKWPLNLFKELRGLDLLTVAYMHDCYLLSGRCAYPGECRKYLTGCDSTCPTKNEYPSLAGKDIAGSWQYRRSLFCGEEGIPIATNSRWVLKQAKAALPSINFAKVVYLGVDCSLYRPIGRGLARQLLGLAEDDFIALFGAVNIEDQRKGGHIFHEISEVLKDRISFLVFGENSQSYKSLNTTRGMVKDFRKMPLLYSAADVYLFLSLEEAFGQTVMEASACGVPVIAFNIGGVGEVALNKKNAVLLDDLNASAVIGVLDEVIEKRQSLEGLGETGIELVRNDFSLHAQGENWSHYLTSLAEEKTIS